MRYQRGRPGDLKEIVRLLNVCFSTYRAWGLDGDRYIQWVEKDPGLGWENVYWAEEKGKLIGHLHVVRRWVRLSGAWVETGGIANLATHPDRRRKGVARGLLQLALEELARDGVPLAALFAGFGEAAHSLYRKCGFSEAYFTRYAVISTLELPHPSQVEVRVATENDVGVVKQIYEETAAAWNGVVHRDEEAIRTRLFRSWGRHTFLQEPERPEVLIAEPARGYAVVWPEKGAPAGIQVVGEMAWRDEQAGLALLSAIATRTKATGLKVFAPTLPCSEAVWFRTPEVYMVKSLCPAELSSEVGASVQALLGRQTAGFYIFHADRW